jgi:DNA-binding response OmpR family regulator
VQKILVVEDYSAVRDLLKHVLAAEEMEAVAVEDGEAALRRLRSEAGAFDFVLLDLMLPGMDGASVCQKIRKGVAGNANRDLPVLMLTARDDETSVVVGLEVGADDYITKPFKPSELVIRVRAHLRRRHNYAKGANNKQYKHKFVDLELDFLKRQVLLKGKPVGLTAKEFEVLELLVTHPGQVYSRQETMNHLSNGHLSSNSRAVDMCIQNIRRKIEPDPKTPRYLQTVRGFGYKFAER